MKIMQIEQISLSDDKKIIKIIVKKNDETNVSIDLSSHLFLEKLKKDILFLNA